jgi:hypothetical protein
MKPSNPIALAGIVLPVALAACGAALELGDFPSISKTEGDSSFALVAPSSKSPAPFSYSSSDASVAAIEGNIVTVKLAGSSTITAMQPSQGSYASASKSMTLTVLPIVCTAPASRANGVCVAAPAGDYIERGARAWMPVASIANWSAADVYCKKTTINGQTGWRLPSEFELTDMQTYLHGTPLPDRQGWVLARTWSSVARTVVAATNPSVTASQPGHSTVNLNNGEVLAQSDAADAYVACVRPIETQ